MLKMKAHKSDSNEYVNYLLNMKVIIQLNEIEAYNL
ncbi:Uncharacterised protein [Staphylococcus aureus]|nr:Uncharacterised protein [Staphylococcus aureus]